MDRPPRHPTEPLLTRALLVRILLRPACWSSARWLFQWSCATAPGC